MDGPFEDLWGMVEQVLELRNSCTVIFVLAERILGVFDAMLLIGILPPCAGAQVAGDAMH